MIKITGEKIELRSFTRQEYHEVKKIYVADPGMDPNPYVYNVENVNVAFDVMQEKESWYPRVGIFLEGNIPIGELSFKRILLEKSQCELGIVLANDNFKGKGYGTEAIELAIQYVFNELKLRYIYADTMGSNYKMQKILNKLGFEFIFKNTDYYDMGNRKEDKLNYVLVSNTNSSLKR